MGVDGVVSEGSEGVWRKMLGVGGVVSEESE